MTQSEPCYYIMLSSVVTGVFTKCTILAQQLKDLPAHCFLCSAVCYLAALTMYNMYNSILSGLTLPKIEPECNKQTIQSTLNQTL